MLRHLPEVAVSLLSGCDTGLDNSDNEGVVVAALHISPKQLLLRFYLFNTALFNKEKKNIMIRFLSELIKKNVKDFLAVASSQEWCVTNCDQENGTSRQ